MAKIKVVVFDKDGGWVLTNPPETEYLHERHVVDPDLSLVKGLPPEKWDLCDGIVVPKKDDVVNLPEKNPSKKYTVLKIAVVLGAVLTLSFLCYALVSLFSL